MKYISIYNICGYKNIHIYYLVNKEKHYETITFNTKRKKDRKETS